MDVLQPGRGTRNFAADVFAGLSAKPKRLDPIYFYDAEGSRLFERICRLPEYYITRTEHEILERCADEIAGFAEPTTLIEFGSGSSEKTRFLIEALLSRQDALSYVPIDISFSILQESSRRLISAYPGLSITAKIGDYHDALERMSETGPGRKLIVFLGSNFGNLDPSQGLRFLLSVGRSMSAGDCFLTGNDLAKEPSILLPAYDDAQKVTAAFNLNLLRRINRELGGNIDVDSFSHLALYDESRHRIEMHLRSDRPQRISIRKLGAWFEFEQGETIHTENSYKYPAGKLDALFQAAGLKPVKRWTDSRGWFSLSLLCRNN